MKSWSKNVIAKTKISKNVVFCWPSKVRKQKQILQRSQYFAADTNVQQSSKIRLLTTEKTYFTSNHVEMQLQPVICILFNGDTYFKYYNCTAIEYIRFCFDILALVEICYCSGKCLATYFLVKKYKVDQLDFLCCLFL